MRPLRQVGACVRLLRGLHGPRRLRADPDAFSCVSASCSSTISTTCVRFLHVQSAGSDLIDQDPAVSAVAAAAKPANTLCEVETDNVLIRRIKKPEASYHTSLRAFNELRSRGEKLKPSQYLSLLYKASKEGRYERVRDVYKAFLEDEKQGQVLTTLIAPTTWKKLTSTRMQMHRFVLWAMLDDKEDVAMTQFYQQEVVGKPNKMDIHEADPFNFLLHLECTGRVDGEQELGLRQRVETLLNSMEHIQYHTSYSAVHALFRLILHRPGIFLKDVAGGQVAGTLEEDTEAGEDAENTTDDSYDAVTVGNLIIDYMNRFPCALALEPKRLSTAVSAAAAAGQHDAARLLLEHGAKNHVPIDAGSFAHAVESARNDADRLKVADLYMSAKEHELVYTTQDADVSIINYLLLHAIYDGNFKHMMELLHEMQLYNNKANNRTVTALFKSIAQYRADIRRLNNGNNGSNDAMNQKLSECPTVTELFEKFPNVIRRTVHSLSQGILRSLFAGDLSVAIDLMRAALWTNDFKLRPEIYSQLLYPLLAGGQRGGDKANDASVFDRLEVERCFDRQYSGQRTHLNALILNICQSNDDLSTMLVCLDRWQGQRHPPLSRRATQRVFDMISKQIQRLQQEGEEITVSTTFVVDGIKLSYLAFLLRYRGIIKWDAWTVGAAIIRAGTCGLQADVVALLAEADSCDLVLESAAYSISLNVLEAAGEPSAVIACSEKMRNRGVWEKTVSKNPKVQEILTRAVAEQEETSPPKDGEGL